MVKLYTLIGNKRPRRILEGVVFHDALRSSSMLGMQCAPERPRCIPEGARFMHPSNLRLRKESNEHSRRIIEGG